MALDDNVLQSLFNRKPRKPSGGSNDIKSKHNHFRVFDDPLKEEIEDSKQPLQSHEQCTDSSKRGLEKTEDKVETNLGQSEDKVETKLRTNLGQSEDKNQVNLGQSEDKVETKLRTNLGQSEDKLETNITIKPRFVSLIGLQQKILILIYKVCKIPRDRISDPLSIDYIATSCFISKFSARKTIQRLENKGFIVRRSFKNGRGGWTRYEIPEAIFQDLVHYESNEKLRTNLGQSEDKVETQLRTSAPSSSSYLTNNKTTTTKDSTKEIEEQNLNNEWGELDIEPLATIGFTRSHLMQLMHQGKLTVEMVQDSIHAFAYDLNYNHKGNELRTSPLNYFMGILRTGKPYAPPANYESPQDLALRLYVEKQQVIANERKQREQDAIRLAFDEWMAQLSEEEENNLIPSNIKAVAKKGGVVHTSALKSHFEQEVWPKLRKEIVGGNHELT